MATPDMTHASGAQDQTEARKSGVRGWFQPPIQPPAADAGGSETDSGAVPDRTGEPGEARAPPPPPPPAPRPGRGAAPPPPGFSPPNAGAPPVGKAAKRSRSVFGPEPASRPD